MSHASYMPEIFIPNYFELEVDKITEIIRNKFPLVTYIACSGISGIVISGAICYKTGKNIFINRKELDDTHSKMIFVKRINEYQQIYEDNLTAIIIDDLISSGNTVKRIVNELEKSKIRCIGIILYHETAYNGGLFDKENLAIPVYSTSQDID